MNLSLIKPKGTEWIAPSVLPDLSGAEEIAIDLETKRWKHCWLCFSCGR